jgi:O-antigen ligase
MHFVLGIRRTVRVKTLVVGSLLFAAAVGLVFSIFEYLQNAPVLGAVVQRLVSTNDFSSSVQGGHMDVRLAGIRYFYDMPLFQKIFGIGYLNYESLHFHSSILTSLVETGVLGLLIWAFIFFMPTCLVLPSLFAPKVSYEFQQARFCIVGIFALLLCHLFYEQPYNATLWVFWVYFHLISVQVNRDRADRRKDKIH